MWLQSIFLEEEDLKKLWSFMFFSDTSPPSAFLLFFCFTESYLSVTTAMESWFCSFSCFLTKMSPCCLSDKQEAWKTGPRSPRHNFQALASTAIITSGTIAVRVVIWAYLVAARALKNQFVNSCFAEECFLGLTGNCGSWAEFSKPSPLFFTWGNWVWEKNRRH